MPREIAHFKGDPIGCVNGHAVAVMARTVYAGEMISEADFAFSAGQRAKAGEKIQCRICKAPLNMEIIRAQRDQAPTTG